MWINFLRMEYLMILFGLFCLIKGIFFLIGALWFNGIVAIGLGAIFVLAGINASLNK